MREFEAKGGSFITYSIGALVLLSGRRDGGIYCVVLANVQSQQLI